MNYNPYLLEKLLVQREHELEGKLAQRRLLADQRKQQFAAVRHLAAQLGALLVALGSKLKQLDTERANEQAVYHQ